MDRYEPKQRKAHYQSEPDLNEREERVTALFTDLVRRVRERQEADRRLQPAAETLQEDEVQELVPS